MAWGAIGGAVAGAVISGAMKDDGGGGSGTAGGQIEQSSAYYDQMAKIGGEQWDVYKAEALPILREMAANRKTTDRTAEEVALAAGDAKDASAAGRASLTRALDLSRNPGDPGYGALLAPSYMDEAAKVSAAVTDARRRERARVEDTNWGRAIQTVQAYQGLPNQANANLSGAAAGGTRNAAALTNLAGVNDARASQAAYGFGNIIARGAARYGTGATASDPYAGGNTDSYSNYPAMDTTDYTGDGYVGGGVKDGGVIRRRYADGDVVDAEPAGGVISGPGHGTSDQVPTRKREGTFILSADVVRAIGTRKAEKMMEDAGVRPGYGEHPDEQGVPIRTSNGEWAMPPEVVQHHGEEFFRALQKKYHRPVATEERSMANGGAIRTRGLPSAVEDAIFREIPSQALGHRRTYGSH